MRTRTEKQGRLPARPEPTLARSFFENAARLYHATPWDVLSDADPLRLDFDGFDDPMYAVIMGQGKETYGLALYLEGSQLIEIYETADSTAAEVIAAIYATENETPEDWNELRRRHRLPIAGPAAIPIPVRHFANNSSAWPDAQEMALLTAALDAATTFIEQHTTQLMAGETCEAMLQLPPAAGQAVVRVSFPAVFEGYRAAPAAPASTPAEAPALDAGVEVTPLVALRERVLAAPGTDRILRRLTWSFFRAPGPPAAKNRPQDSEHAVARFVEWAVFCARLPPDHRTLAERACDDDAGGMTEEESSRRTRFIHPRWSVFEVLQVDRGAGMDVRDLVAGSSVRLRERAGTRDILPGNTLLGPIFPLDDSDEWILGGGITAWSETPALTTDAEPLEPHEMATVLEDTVHGANVEWIARLDDRQLRAVWEDFRSSFADTDTKLPRFGRLLDWIRLAKSPLDVMRRLENLAWWNPIEVDVLLALIRRAWTLVPNKPPLGPAH